ncbi:hypothetical protein MBLNU459_g4211t1 [Dothideomycetes sp. NU459]
MDFIEFGNLPSDETLARDNFATWLFDTEGSSADFSMADLPFLDFGLESTLSNNFNYDVESSAGQPCDTETVSPEECENSESVPEFQRQALLQRVRHFMKKQPRYLPRTGLLLNTSANGDMPGLSLVMLQDCVISFWDHVSQRLPVVHQPTFSYKSCHPLLLMVMIALGASTLHNQAPEDGLLGYQGFADLLISNLRWEICTDEEAQPPVELWVAQALLLLEYYEKLYSSRRLHERAHIYHSATLTLLRRGSPLIGRSGSETPPSRQQPEDRPNPPQTRGHHEPNMKWLRWAETEAMHRVVFATFMMDIIHASMYGHVADMAPHEIRLPLPCDEALWTARSYESIQRFDSNLRMYGVKPIGFLEGLKRALHGQEVMTHSFARMIVIRTGQMAKATFTSV